ncbi:hypothetical protein NF675_19605 [Pseudomonas siliginis]|uniref:hypothetical protein n=1 Tax=Pseudomonas siliginis TaxID=2842346 RepID=UPI0020938503|nr:hypothetical protein [Pseudomonas siliginis]UST73195.1 hypothetical protein NF675_19605 [Pseudomonas siliginis]
MQNKYVVQQINVDDAQYTPLGYFPEEIDLANLTSNESLLTREKHQLLEGLVIEYVAEQFISSPFLKDSIVLLDVVTLIVRGIPDDHSNALGQYCNFIWKRDNSDIEDFISILKNLSQGCASTTFLCKEENMKFHTQKPGSSKWLPLQRYLCKKRKITNDKEIKFPQVNAESKDNERQLSSILGRLLPAYNKRIIRDVILPRVFKNYIIQPFFRSGWDLDRIFRYKGKLWEFELKHKYPIDNYEFFEKINNTNNRYCLSFGINEGQANIIKLLADQGLNTLHLILVKPRWTDQEDPGYLFVDEDARKNTLVIGAVLTPDKINAIMKGDLKKAPSKTSFSGASKANYYRIPRNFFQVIGRYADGKDNLTPNIIRLLDGNLNSPLTTDTLLENRLS